MKNDHSDKEHLDKTQLSSPVFDSDDSDRTHTTALEDTEVLLSADDPDKTQVVTNNISADATRVEHQDHMPSGHNPEKLGANDATLVSNINISDDETAISPASAAMSNATAINDTAMDATIATATQTPNKTGYSQLSDFSQEARHEVLGFVGIGTEINQRFKLEKLLGRGGMGDVYLATDKRKLEAQDKNPHVALKVLGENFKKHPQAFVALQREARKTQELAHPNIVTVYDFDRHGDTVYLTMEALSGCPMDEEIRSASDQRSSSDAIDMIIQCASGLAYAHKKGLVHSDLKPGNVFITADKTVKLLDFGIARAFKSGKDLDSQTHNDTVFDAGDLGALTPAYATVEMIDGEDPHPADDVYALGIIAYELLTGQHPFDKTMANKAMKQGMTATRKKNISKQQWQAIENALAFKRADRLPDAQAFLQQFTAKSRLPLIVASIVTVIAFVVVSTLNLWYAQVPKPDRPFDELPVAQQEQVSSQIKDGRMALKFGDFNSAILHQNKAFQLHPYNAEVMKLQDDILDQLIQSLNTFDSASKKKQLQSLLRYESLKGNKRLLELSR